MRNMAPDRRVGKIINTDTGINKTADVNIDRSGSVSADTDAETGKSMDADGNEKMNKDVSAVGSAEESMDLDGKAADCPACLAGSGDGAGCCGSCGRKKKRTEKEYRDMINRLNRIEGQVRGIRRMVNEDAYCPDILIQVSAIQAALNSFNKVLLANHIRTCVAEDIRAGKDEIIDELVRTMMKLMK